MRLSERALINFWDGDPIRKTFHDEAASEAMYLRVCDDVHCLDVVRASFGFEWVTMNIRNLLNEKPSGIGYYLDRQSGLPAEVADFDLLPMSRMRLIRVLISQCALYKRSTVYQNVIDCDIYRVRVDSRRRSQWLLAAHSLSKQCTQTTSVQRAMKPSWYGTHRHFSAWEYSLRKISLHLYMYCSQLSQDGHTLELRGSRELLLLH